MLAAFGHHVGLLVGASGTRRRAGGAHARSGRKRSDGGSGPVCTKLEIGTGQPTLAMLKVAAQELATMESRFLSEASLSLGQRVPKLLATLRARGDARELAAETQKAAGGAEQQASKLEDGKLALSTVGYPKVYQSALQELVDRAEFIEGTAKIQVAVEKMFADPAAAGSHPSDVVRLIMELNLTPCTHSSE